MKKRVLFYIAIAIAVIALALDVYYVLPWFPHVLATNSDHGPYLKHLVLLSAIVVVCGIAAFVIRIRTKSSVLQKT